MKIISASRRTDIPALYGDWFLKRLKEGYCEYFNPYGGQKYSVSLKPEDVLCFVFWSKDYKPFVSKLEIIEKMGYRFYFNYTITGLPKKYEHNSVGRDIAIDTIKDLSRRYSPEHINWRYDPIIISDSSDFNFHLYNFEYIASKLNGHVKRCYFSYVVHYTRVKRNLAALHREYDIRIEEPKINLKVNLSVRLAEIAGQYGIRMFSCCGDYLLGPKIEKAHCIDREIIKELFGLSELRHRAKPTRRECGCVESIDIGVYNTCSNGCVYCYANIDKKTAREEFINHNKNTPFLGHT